MSIDQDLRKTAPAALQLQHLARFGTKVLFSSLRRSRGFRQHVVCRRSEHPLQGMLLKSDSLAGTILRKSY